MSGYGPSSYGDAFADVYDEWYAQIGDVDAMTTMLVAMAGEGPVLELGVGSGRVALPLAAKGLPVVGMDASAAMLDRLTDNDPEGSVLAVRADMADPPLRGPFSLAVIAFNTLFNLVDPAAQQRCLAGVAAALAPRGRVVVEAFVPSADPETEGGVEVREVSAGRVVLSVSHTDVDRQVVTGQHIEITASGNRLRPWQLCYRSPAQLDDTAAAAGLALVDRWAGWNGEPFTEASEAHVSVYGRRP